jgi:TolB protein
VLSLGIATICFPSAKAFAIAQSASRPIAFFSDRDGDTEIYAMAADGTGVMQLTHNAVEDRDPAWAPGGSRLAFLSRRDGNIEIYLTNPDGTGVRRLTNNPASDHSPAWSPDGRRIVFVSDATGNQDLYLLDLEGASTPERLTTNEFEDVSPAWSPDGTEILFSSNREFPGSQDGSGDLYLMNVATRATRRLQATVRRTVSASWSARGVIAFFALPNRARHIYTVAPDGSGLKNLSEPIGARADYHPTLSADGAQIAFQGDRSGNGTLEVFVMAADGTKAKRLSPPQLPTAGPLSWSADGASVAFSVFEDGNWEVYVAAADGSTRTRLTRNKAMDLGVAWATASTGRK